jgi:hypothetical protein
MSRDRDPRETLHYERVVRILKRIRTNGCTSGVIVLESEKGFSMGFQKLTCGSRDNELPEWERLGADIHVVFWVRLLDKFIGRARQDLGPRESEHAWNEGSAMPFEDAVATALAEGEAR